jgi:hypothetical protein
MIKTLPRRAPNRAAESSRQVGEDMKDKEADPQPAEVSFHTLSGKIKVIT